MGGSRGGGDRGSNPPPPPLKNHQNIGFLSKTGPDRLKNHKATKQHSMLGHHRPASVKPFKWRCAGGPMMAHFWWYLVLSLIIQKTNKKKTLSELAFLWQNFLDPHIRSDCSLWLSSLIRIQTICLHLENDFLCKQKYEADNTSR